MSEDRGLGMADARDTTLVPGPHLRRQAGSLLRQLAANRPRRALDLDATRRLLEAVVAASDIDKLLADLIRTAWEWGGSCEIDDVQWGEPGDSYNAALGYRTAEAAARIQAAFLAYRPQRACAQLKSAAGREVNDHDSLAVPGVERE